MAKTTVTLREDIYEKAELRRTFIKSRSVLVKRATYSLIQSTVDELWTVPRIEIANMRADPAKLN